MWWIIHILAFLFFMPALFVTIPLHLINNSVKPKMAVESTEEKPTDYIDRFFKGVGVILFVIGIFLLVSNNI